MAFPRLWCHGNLSLQRRHAVRSCGRTLPPEEIYTASLSNQFREHKHQLHRLGVRQRIHAKQTSDLESHSWDSIARRTTREGQRVTREPVTGIYKLCWPNVIDCAPEFRSGSHRAAATLSEEILSLWRAAPWKATLCDTAT